MSNTNNTGRVITIETSAIVAAGLAFDHVVLFEYAGEVIDFEACGADEEPIAGAKVPASLLEAAIADAVKAPTPAGFIGGLYVYGVR